MTPEELAMHVEEGEGYKIRFDELINEKFIYPQDLGREKLNTFLELAGLSTTLSHDRILNERQKKALKRVKVEGKITNKEYADLNKLC